MADIRTRARRSIVRNYGLDKCLRDQIRMVESLAEGRRPGNVTAVPANARKPAQLARPKGKERSSSRSRPQAGGR